jgi:branched-chain amino acid transport system substrate-binding protein
MRRYLKLSLLVVLAIALVSTFAIGCGGSGSNPTPSATKEPYKIGALFSTTGSQSNLGVPEENTVRMLVKKINGAGGINGHPLEVVIYNDETDSTKCATLATKLIEEDKVLAIIGPTGTGNSMAIIETVTSAKIPLVSCAAGASIVTPVEERYWIFKTPQTDKQVVTEIYVHLQSLGITKVAIITSTSGFGQGGKTYLESEASKFGITLVDNQTFGSDDTSMISQLTHIKGTDAQAVIVWDTDKASAVVAKDMKTLQFQIPLFASHGIANRAFIDAAGDAANGVVFPAGKLLVVDEVPASDPQKKDLTAYKNEYLAAYPGESISTFGGHAYDALYLVVEALDDMDEGLSLAASRAAIRDNLEQIRNFVGISGVFTTSPTDHLGMQPGSLALIEIVNGKWTVSK